MKEGKTWAFNKWHRWHAGAGVERHQIEGRAGLGMRGPRASRVRCPRAWGQGGRPGCSNVRQVPAGRRERDKGTAQCSTMRHMRDALD